MSSTLYFRKTPTNPKSTYISGVLKSIFAKRFYEQEGGGSSIVTLDGDCLYWLQGLYAGYLDDDKDRKMLIKIIDIISDGDTVDIWFEY